MSTSPEGPASGPTTAASEPGSVPFPRTVLVPLDGSGFAERAIGPAKVLAERLDVGVGVVQVVDDEKDADDEYLTKVAREHGLAWHHTAVDDDVAGGILAVAEARDAAVCIATHGHGRAAAVIGSTLEALLARSEEPVVAVGRGVDTRRIRRIDRIVVALDGSDEAEALCRPAIEWARRLGLVVNLITVVGEPMTSLRDEKPRRAFGLDEPEPYIASVVERHRTEGVEVVGEVLTDPISPASGLGTLLRDVPHSVLATATHNRSGTARLLHGSVAASIVDAAPVPVVMFTHAQLRRPW